MRTRTGAKDKNLSLQDDDKDAVLNSATGNWRMWCRLCAKEDPEGNLYVLLKDEQAENTATSISIENVIVPGAANNNLCIAESVQKYFSVQINSEDLLPKMLCKECFSLITSLVNFSERVVKVQQMFLTLRDSPEGTEVDTNILRLKYGVLDEERGNLFIHRPLAEVHYLETNVHNKRENQQSNESDEVPIANPLEPLNPLESHIKIKIKKENLPVMEVRDEDIKQNNSDDDNEHDEDDDDDAEDNDDDDFSRNDASESSDSEQMNVASISDFKGESQNLTKHDSSKDTTKLTRNQRNRRQRNSNESNESDSTKKESSESYDDLDLPCAECPRKFKDQKRLRHHITRAHSKRPPAIDRTCPQCPLVFKSLYKLKKHLRIVHLIDEDKKPVNCSYCDKELSTKYHLRVHIKHVHKDERPFVCEKCGAGRKTRCALKEHMLMHSDYAPYKCEICERAFKAKYHLKVHMETHNPNKYICATCGLQLNSRKTLRTHQWVHSDKMACKCDYCGRGFKSPKTLKWHLVSHTGIKPYCCNFCDRAYSNGLNCRLHVQKMHPVEASAGGNLYTLNMPKTEALKTISKTADNLVPVLSGPGCKQDTSTIRKDK